MMIKTQRGVSMVEVLVTVLIFGLGVLSVAGLQSVSKRSLYEAAQRSAATQLADSMLERMRSNGAALATYVAAATLGSGTLTAPASMCADPANGCTALQIAALDLWQLEQGMDGADIITSDGTQVGGLVIPSACITGDVTGVAGFYTISIAWYGSAELGYTGANTCGASLGRYGTGDVNRRILQLTTYIDPDV